ncbi:MAG TPA: biotin-dependent carboxyltransferase family protein [Phnomibacter sp.]|nr:biotin-dependent carboxyltransferase family protein [Phnomibacter sp.]
MPNSMQIIKPGILDTIQDLGRPGFAHLGVGVGGCMDPIAGQIANMLAGNDPGDAVLEMHFPAPVLFFPEGAVIGLAGADFGAVVGGVPIPVNRRIVIPRQGTLEFSRRRWGQRTYLAVEGGWEIAAVMGSRSTHLQAGFGGWMGRALTKGDELPLHMGQPNATQRPGASKWFPDIKPFYSKAPIRVMPGPEWQWLLDGAQQKVLDPNFMIGKQSDRMGYHLQGPVIVPEVKKEMLSSPVLPGTIQLLPNGQPLLLMADAQTTGGYPRVLQVAATDLPRLAQTSVGEFISFKLIDAEQASDLVAFQEFQLRVWQNSIALMIGLRDL